MPFGQATIRAVAFDYGNTLVTFSHEAVQHQHTALSQVLARHFGSVDIERLNSIRAADRMQPYETGYIENELPVITANLVRQLYGVEPAPALLDELLRARYQSFLEAIRLPDGVKPILARLAHNYDLGLLSNYPDGEAVRESMRRIGIADLFEAAVVSGDVGYCKPHPAPFEELVRRLGVPPDTIVFVGDNWLADIQGAKQQGMFAVLFSQFAPIDHFEPRAGDLEPDHSVGNLDELADLLLDSGVRRA